MPAKKSPKLFPSDRYELTAEDKKRFADEQALGMVAPNDPILVKKAVAVDPKTVGSDRIADVVQRLLATAGGQQQADPGGKKLRLLVGLAGPQIGESLRIIVVDTKILPSRKKAGKLECFINPQIIWRSRETDELREGCFSAGPVWGLVRRPVAVKIRAFTPDGQKVERIFEDFTARIMQHEIDHLDGFRFPDRIQNDRKRHWVHAEEIPLYPEHIHHWPRLCSLARWHDFIA
jgi:peptide deformylase